MVLKNGNIFKSVALNFLKAFFLALLMKNSKTSIFVNSKAKKLEHVFFVGCCTQYQFSLSNEQSLSEKI